ncbi:MAG: hypothetical protein FWD71_06725 [Oscillospiraceae bacterium]|nr:hypothetical protein [Oscillospiraceae bacterium]
MGRKQVKCHGDNARFDEVANFIYERYGNTIKYIADVAGGQGLLTKILNKKYNYESEVIDPREYQVKGVSNRQSEYSNDMADYYDLIVGLHPDEATREVVESAHKTSVLIIPCCNFWDRTKKLGAKELVAEICGYFDNAHIKYEIIKFNFKGPKNVGILTNHQVKSIGGE